MNSDTKNGKIGAEAKLEVELGLAKVGSEISEFGQNLFLAAPFQIFDREVEDRVRSRCSFECCKARIFEDCFN